jgi:hypothetical protein
MAASWNVTQSQSNEALSDVVLANIEALANEGSGNMPCRANPDDWDEICNIYIMMVFIAPTAGDLNRDRHFTASLYPY